MTMSLLTRIAQALERLAPVPKQGPQLSEADAFIWTINTLIPIQHVNRVDIDVLKGIERVKIQLLENTARFAYGWPANNALLWGARGMGKSSLIKAVHHKVNKHEKIPHPLKLIEIHREEIETLPALMAHLRSQPFRCLVLCDDLSFDEGDTSYKSLKTALEGGLEGRPNNVLFYATSNRRHLMPRDMIDNEQSSAIHPGEAIEEKISLSDRFGLWLGFHACSQDDYLEMVQAYAKAYRLPIKTDDLNREALEWAITRGSRSGRTSWQFIQDLAGRLQCSLTLD